MAKKKAGRPTEWTPAKLEKLGKDLHDFCRCDEVYHISEFELDQGQAPGWLQTIASRHEKFRPILKGARHILGQKLVKQAMGGAGNNWIIGKFVPMYLQDVDDYEELKKDRDLERDKAREKYKKELNQASEEQAESLTASFTDTAKLVYENQRLKEELEKLKGD